MLFFAHRVPTSCIDGWKVKAICNNQPLNFVPCHSYIHRASFECFHCQCIRNTAINNIISISGTFANIMHKQNKWEMQLATCKYNWKMLHTIHIQQSTTAMRCSQKEVGCMLFWMQFCLLMTFGWPVDECGAAYLYWFGGKCEYAHLFPRVMSWCEWPWL